MKAYTLSDLNRQPGQIVDAALAEPVLLTKRGRGKLVMMSAAAYEILKHGKSFSVDAMPDAIADMMNEALERAQDAMSRELAEAAVTATLPTTAAE